MDHAHSIADRDFCVVDFRLGSNCKAEKETETTTTNNNQIIKQYATDTHLSNNSITDS